jgi:hypothetical protein
MILKTGSIPCTVQIIFKTIKKNIITNIYFIEDVTFRPILLKLKSSYIERFSLWCQTIVDMQVFFCVCT